MLQPARGMARRVCANSGRCYGSCLVGGHERQHAECMLNSFSGGIGQVPVAVYSCAAEPAAIREAEQRARHYADARHWQVAGLWSDDDPAEPLNVRPSWTAVMSALSSRLFRGIVVAGQSHLTEDAHEFAALGTLIRERGGFLAEATSPPVRRTPGQHERRRILFEASAGWWLWADLTPGAVS